MYLHLSQIPVVILISMATGTIATHKNRNAMVWAIAGVLFVIVPFILILFLRRVIKCPCCGKKIPLRSNALCRKCLYDWGE